MDIVELKTRKEITQAFAVVNELRTHLDLNKYLELVTEAMETDNYHMFAMMEEEEIVAVAGLKPMVTLYYGRFVWVNDLVVTSEKRNNGYGEIMLHFVEQWAAQNKYDHVALSSGLEKAQAHKFYQEKMDYDKASYVFLKKNV
ncbi:GNAT family N-acetyltransferase [Salimicrobium halophilum]|uniref:Acetyltransferase (GNAT) domain-containing protein n=1 Tax=Salimicrobium halophilum TaxID=86666 RepID=A0A1G8RIP5_9BACI|nr:GNAT family N-acetyltransferase [Salimicrobium halophilum]SDJ16811.1 Acetyltransferase (GNAT) domain-containing protein [Salimicrobium halophilum]